MSINSLVFRIAFAVIAPVIGAIASRYSLFTGLTVAGCIFFGFGLFCWWQLVRVKAFPS